MFITHFHLIAVYAQVVRILRSIRWNVSGYGIPSYPDDRLVDRLELMGHAIESQLLGASHLVPLHAAIRKVFIDKELRRRAFGGEHEMLCNNLRAVVDVVREMLSTLPRMPIRPLEYAAADDLAHFIGEIPKDIYQSAPEPAWSKEKVAAHEAALKERDRKWSAGNKERAAMRAQEKRTGKRACWHGGGGDNGELHLAIENV